MCSFLLNQVFAESFLSNTMTGFLISFALVEMSEKRHSSLLPSENKNTTSAPFSLPTFWSPFWLKISSSKHSRTILAFSMKLKNQSSY